MKNIVKFFRETLSFGYIGLSLIMAGVVTMLSLAPVDDFLLGSFVKILLFGIVFAAINGVMTLEEVQKSYENTIKDQSEEIRYLKSLLLDKESD